MFVGKASELKAEAVEFILIRSLFTFFVAGVILKKSKTHIWSDIPTG
jgi:hypothetical protein